MPLSPSFLRRTLSPVFLRHADDRRRRLPAVAISLCCLLAVTSAAGAKEAPSWALDPVHTRVMFAVSHAGFSQALGTISGSEGRLQFDAADWSQTRLEATVPVNRLDLGDQAWNRAALASRLLDATTYPLAHFSSDRADATQDGPVHVCGELTLRGVTRPLCMEVTVNAIKRHPMPPFRRTAGFSATARLSRSDFGIDAWPNVIGDEVVIRIEAEAIRSTAPSPPDGAARSEPLPPPPDPAPGVRP